MARFVSLVGVLVVVMVSFAALGEGLVVLNPSDPNLSNTDRGTMLETISGLETRLGEGFPIPKQQLVRRGWSASDFAQFVRGLLQTEGYAVEVATRGTGAAAWYWLFVAIPLADGITTWIPVEVTTSLTPDWWSLGRIPWAETGSRFDEAFMSYDEVVRPPSNALPSASIIQPRRAVVGGANPFSANAQDPDGQIVIYVWSVDGEVVAAGQSPSVDLEFGTTEGHRVDLTVFDNRGGQGHATLDVSVYEEYPDCGCH